MKISELDYLETLNPEIVDGFEEFIKDCNSNVSKMCSVKINLIDLTSLNDTDSVETIEKLYKEGVCPLDKCDMRVASICVYPLYVQTCKKLSNTYKALPITTVEPSFPHGKLSLSVSCFGINQSLADGANEIDIVIDRGLVFSKDWKALLQDIKCKKSAITQFTKDSSSNQPPSQILMKTILSCGDLIDPILIYKAAYVAMLGDSDFIKSSTGKEPKTTEPQMVYAMLKAIKFYYEQTGRKVGIKIAGGVKTTEQALLYLVMVEKMLGKDWLNSTLFRIGASKLLYDLRQKYFELKN